jgi:hypothetical protein
LQQQRQTGSSLSIVLPFISVFTVSMSFSSLMVLGFLRVSDRRTALAAATIRVRNPAELQALSRHCAANYMSETWTCASALRESHLGSAYSKQLDCNLEDDLAAGMSRYFTG